jgi:hypothetical protein
VFEDETLRVGTSAARRRMVPVQLDRRAGDPVGARAPSAVTDFWSGASLGARTPVTIACRRIRPGCWVRDA